MKRIALGVGLVVVGLGMVNWSAAEAPAPPPRTSHAPAALCEALQQPISIDKPIEGSPLKDVLEFLSDKYNLTFIVDTQAFEQAGVGGGRNVEDTQVRLPKMPGVTLSTVLRFLFAQVNGTYLVRRDYIEITTRDRQITEAFGPGPFDPAALPPTVNVVFDNRQLESALGELAGQSGKNVVLDPRVPNTDKLFVRVKLLNTPVDTAIRVAAELAGQKVVVMDNVFYVTTPEHAKALQVEQKSQPSRLIPPTPPQPLPGGIPPGALPGAPRGQSF